MKKIAALLTIIPVCLISYGQGLRPTADFGLIRIKMLNMEKVVSPAIQIMGTTSGRNYNISADAAGIGEVLLPVSESYVISHYETIGFDLIHIPDKPDYVSDYTIDFSDLPDNPVTKAPLILYVFTISGNPVRGENVYFISKSSGMKFTRRTDALGQLLIRLPVNETFIIEFNNAPNYQEVFIPENHRLISQFDVIYEGSGKDRLQPSMHEALVDFLFIDLHDQPVPGEKITLTGLNSGKTYSLTTDSIGQVQVLLPHGDQYEFSLIHKEKYDTLDIETGIGLSHLEYTIKYIRSSKWFELEKLRAQQIRRRDSLFALQDTLSHMSAEQKAVFLTKLWKQNNEANSAIAEREIAKDSTYFEKSKRPIAAAFYRMRKKWRNKIIVMDLTCSMDPYAQELLLWTSLKITAGERNKILFFNDGDGKPNSMKVTGSTGGFYYTASDDLDTLISVMMETKRTGCSGDGPENDLEALLEGNRYRRPFGELILVADNYSSVRDIELLKDLSVPVRIILCGMERRIHEDYLYIAAKTGGSVHTVEEDISNLSEHADGETITIGGHEYYFIRGMFLPILSLR